MRAGERVETPELIDDRGSGLDWRFLGKGGACPSEDTVLNEGSNTVGDMTGQAEVGPRVLLAMRGRLPDGSQSSARRPSSQSWHLRETVMACRGAW